MKHFLLFRRKLCHVYFTKWPHVPWTAGAKQTPISFIRRGAETFTGNLSLRHSLLNVWWVPTECLVCLWPGCSLLYFLESVWSMVSFFSMDVLISLSSFFFPTVFTYICSQLSPVGIVFLYGRVWRFALFVVLVSCAIIYLVLFCHLLPSLKFTVWEAFWVGEHSRRTSELGSVRFALRPVRGLSC